MSEASELVNEMKAMAEIRPVRSGEEIAEVVRLAREIWEGHYVPIIGQEQVDYMLDKFQSEPAITEQLAKGYEYFLAVNDGQSAGYTAVVPNEAEASCLLSKIYVRQPLRGLGIGKQMLAHVEDLCRQRGITRIWLTVNRHNEASIDWYDRMGFRTAGPIVQDIGGGFVMDDHMMEKTIPRSNPAESDASASNVSAAWQDRPLGEIAMEGLKKWWASLKSPDPWDAETDEHVRSGEATPVCHRCFHPVASYTAFCPHCNTAVGSTNNLHPYWRLFSIGEVARSGIGEHAHFTKLNVLGYAFFGLSQYGFLAPLYFQRFSLWPHNRPWHSLFVLGSVDANGDANG